MKVISRPKFKKTFTCDRCHTTYSISAREIFKNGTQSITDKNKYIVDCPYCYFPNGIDVSKELEELRNKKLKQQIIKKWKTIMRGIER